MEFVLLVLVLLYLLFREPRRRGIGYRPSPPTKAPTVRPPLPPTVGRSFGVYSPEDSIPLGERNPPQG